MYSVYLGLKKVKIQELIPVIGTAVEIRSHKKILHQLLFIVKYAAGFSLQMAFELVFVFVYVYISAGIANSK